MGNKITSLDPQSLVCNQEWDALHQRLRKAPIGSLEKLNKQKVSIIKRVLDALWELQRKQFVADIDPNIIKTLQICRDRMKDSSAYIYEHEEEDACIGETILTYVVYKNYSQLIKPVAECLVDNVNEYNSIEQSAMGIAVANGSTAQVMELLRANCFPFNVQGEYSALQMAYAHRHEDLVNVFLSEDLLDDEQHTNLSFIISNNNPGGYLKQYFRNYSDLNSLAIKDKPILFWIVDHIDGLVTSSYLKISNLNLKVLYKIGENLWDVLSYSLLKKRKDVFDYLVKHKADPNSIQISAATVSCYLDTPETFLWLLNQHSLHPKLRQALSLLHYVICKGTGWSKAEFATVLNTLFTYNLIQGEETTTNHLMCYMCYKLVPYNTQPPKKLCDCRRKYYQRVYKGTGVIGMAVLCQNIENLRILLETKKFSTEPDSNITSPLVMAIVNRNIKAAKALIEYGAILNDPISVKFAAKNKSFEEWDTPVTVMCKCGEWGLAHTVSETHKIVLPKSFGKWCASKGLSLEHSAFVKAISANKRVVFSAKEHDDVLETLLELQRAMHRDEDINGDDLKQSLISGVVKGEKPERFISKLVDTMANDGVCQICITNPKSVAAIPCGHYAYCEECIQRYKKPECIMCKQRVTRWNKIYAS